MELEKVPSTWKISDDAVRKPITQFDKKRGIRFNTWQKFPILICKFCNSRYVKVKHKQVYCSWTCKSKYNVLERTHSWKGGKRKEREYTFLYIPGHPLAGKRNYVPEHRLVMSEHIGRMLEPGEQVHHINGNKSDNRIENLSLLSKSEHMRLHRLKDARDSTGWHKNCDTPAGRKKHDCSRK